MVNLLLYCPNRVQPLRDRSLLLKKLISSPTFEAEISPDYLETLFKYVDKAFEEDADLLVLFLNKTLRGPIRLKETHKVRSLRELCGWIVLQTGNYEASKKYLPFELGEVCIFCYNLSLK
jgi:hypothetical protein